ncbi:MAG: hypothetical protein IJK48_06260 [Bacteroidales bacterium]|nr:hypothetical protein [Bacteroidales bacterium]
MKLASNAEIISGEDYSMLCSRATPQFVLFLVDESISMKREVDGITCVQRACDYANQIVNALIKANFNKDRPANRLFICVATYDMEVKPLVCGYLSDIYSKPLRIDDKKRRVMGVDGTYAEMVYEQPIWVDKTATDHIANLKASIDYARELLSMWVRDKYDTPAPIVVNITCGNHDIDEPLAESIQELKKIRTVDGESLFLNFVVDADENQDFPVIKERGGKDNNLMLASSIIPSNYQVRI